MRVALLYPSWSGEYGLFGYFARRSSTFPPLNLALLAAIAEQNGHEVIIIDGQVERLSLNKVINRVLDFKPDIIGLTATSPFFHITKHLAEGLKETNNNIPILLGGQHITITKEESFAPCFDYALLGDVEDTFPQFLNVYEKGNDMSSVNNLIYRSHNEVIFTECVNPSPVGEYPLDRFPFPARHLLDMKKYKIGTLQGVKNFTTIQTMRGCPWSCIFCASEPLHTTKVMWRSPRSVVDEIKSVVKNHNIRHFYFVDNVLTLRKSHIVGICDLLDEDKLSITFESATRANLVDDELIARLAKSGLIRLSFGLETVDPTMRDIIDKRVPMDSYIKANSICNKYGIEVLNTLMIGLPGETRQTIKTTLDYLKNAKEVKQASFAIAIPYPGTRFHEIAKNGGYGIKLMTTDFSKYRRYGSAVTTVGDLTPKDLLELQNDGFASIYSASWRWKPMLRKMGIIGGILTFTRMIQSWCRRKEYAITN